MGLFCSRLINLNAPAGSLIRYDASHLLQSLADLRHVYFFLAIILSRR